MTGAALSKGSATPPPQSTAQIPASRNGIAGTSSYKSGQLSRWRGVSGTPIPSPSNFLFDVERPARLEAARQRPDPDGCEPVGAWQPVGEAAWRAFARLQAGQQPDPRRGRPRR